MGSKHGPRGARTRSSIIFIGLGLCCFFYLLGGWQKSGFGKGDRTAMVVIKHIDCTIIPIPGPNMDFEPHHKFAGSFNSTEPKVKRFKACDSKYTDYTPCQEQNRAMRFTRENMIYRERHCPEENEKLRCLIPAPKGYKTPFPSPKGRDYVHYANVPYKHLTVEKSNQHWAEYMGTYLNFRVVGPCFLKVLMLILKS